jgi:hypothetical protein
LLGAYRDEFALNISADRSVGPEGFQAPGELVSVDVQLAVRKLDNLAAVSGRRSRNGAVRLARREGRVRCPVKVMAEVTHEKS